MTTLRSKWQFRLRHLFLSILALGVILAAHRGGLIHKGNLIMGAFTALVPMSFWAYFRLNNRGRRRARIWITIISTLIGISPFLGAGGYAFIAPGASEPLPRVEFMWLMWLLMPFYLLGESVLYFVDWLLGLALGSAYVRIIIFADEGPARVRPFAVCVFWLGVASAFGSPLLIEGLRKRRGRRSNRDQAVETVVH